MLNSSNTQVNARSALKGMNIKVGVNLDADPAMMYIPQGQYIPSDGLLYQIQQEIARRGEFTLNYVLVDQLGKFQSTDDFLKAIAPQCDIYGAGVVTDTAHRRNEGIDFTVGVLDNSVLMATTVSIGRSSDLWAFTLPFLPQLWGFLYGFAAIHAVLFWFTERCRPTPINVEEEAEGEDGKEEKQNTKEEPPKPSEMSFFTTTPAESTPSKDNDGQDMEKKKEPQPVKRKKDEGETVPTVTLPIALYDVLLLGNSALSNIVNNPPSPSE